MYICVLSVIMTEISEVKRTIGHFLVNYFWQPKILLANFISAIFHCLLNIVSIKLWFAVGCFLIFYLFATGVGLVIEYICGGIGYIIKEIIIFVSKIVSFLTWSSVHYDVKAIDALAALVDGECSQFSQTSFVVNYWWTRIVGTSLCDKLEWYETITLTRVLIARPLGIILFLDGIDSKCHMISMTNDMCAAVIGSLSLLKWMVSTGIWIFVGCIIFAPLLRFACHVVKILVRVLYTEIFCALYHVTNCKK